MYTFKNGNFYWGVKQLSMYVRGDKFIVYTPHGNKQAHRLLWEIVNGPIPANRYVIPKDGDFANLDPANFYLDHPGVNKKNKKKEDYPHLKGCHFHKESGRWYARTCINYEQIFIGSFETEQEAHDAYVAFKASLER